MKEVTVQRLLGTNTQTLGILYTVVDGELFVAKTMELSDKNNAPRVSCIPKGSYTCKFTYSPSFKKKTYEIMGVPNRTAIRIHGANYSSQLLGCIAIGSALKDLNRDGQQDITQSGATMLEFEKIMNGQDFLLRVQ